jgi:hypothetical protein
MRDCITAAAEHRARAHGLTSTKRAGVHAKRALAEAALRERGSATAQDLAEATGLSTSSLARILPSIPGIRRERVRKRGAAATRWVLS